MMWRITIGIVGAFALILCFVSISDVHRNSSINNPQPTMTILWVTVTLIVVAGLLAVIRNSKLATVVSLVASGLGILFSLVLACV
jgi:hypothetical protein